jgi:hypothetical protein
MHNWLKGWMSLNGDKFLGDHGKNVGREFLELMLRAPPVIVAPNSEANENSEMAFVDPVDIAAKIMAERQCVAERYDPLSLLP